MFTTEMILLASALVGLLKPIVLVFCYWFALELSKRYGVNLPQLLDALTDS